MGSAGASSGYSPGRDDHRSKVGAARAVPKHARLAGKAIETRVKRLISDFTALIRDALSTPAARQRLSCDPDIAAELAVTFTRGLAVMERAFRNPRHLEKMAQQFVRMLLPEEKRRRSR